MLYLLFRAWLALLSEDRQALVIYLDRLRGDAHSVRGRSWVVQQRTAQAVIAELISERLRQLSPVMWWPYGEHLRPTGTPSFALRASRLFDYVFFQLASLIMKPESEVKRGLKQCHGCSQFVWGHGNRRYCSRCDRRTLWSRKTRAAQRVSPRNKVPGKHTPKNNAQIGRRGQSGKEV
jgi:hypothetical protein